MSSGDGKSKQTRKGPAPFASFEDVSDEVKQKSSSPENKPAFNLPQIEENVRKGDGSDNETEDQENVVAILEQTSNTLQTPSTPRIDISRASSSSHHDSRDSSPEMALFAGKEKEPSNLVLGFKEDGALDLRSSTEELSFFEPNTASGEVEVPKSPSRKSSINFKIEDKSQSHVRKDSQTSDTGLLGISGRTSRLSSIGSQSSAHSNISAQSNFSHISINSHLSHVSGRLSIVSGVSRSPSPHKMVLETSFCGPKPIEAEVDLSNRVSTENLLDIALPEIIIPDPIKKENVIVKASENQVEVIVETHAEKSEVKVFDEIAVKEIKNQKQISNDLIVKDPKVAKKVRRQQGHSNIKKESKDIIRIKLKPDHMYDDDDDDSEKTLTNSDLIQKPATLNLSTEIKKTPQCYQDIVNPLNTKMNVLDKPEENIPMQRLSPHASPSPSTKNLNKETGSRTPSPAAISNSRKSSFCSLFKSKEAVTSPGSPMMTHRRKSRNNSTDSTRSRSKSREKSSTPSSASKIKGSVLSLFKSSRHSNNPSAANSRDTSPVIQAMPTTSKLYTPIHVPPHPSGEKLKYYEDSKDGIIHIPLHTPPEDKVGTSKQFDSTRGRVNPELGKSTSKKTNNPGLVKKSIPVKPPQIPKTEKLPDGIIIIPLHSPTEKENVNKIPLETNKTAIIKEPLTDSNKQDQIKEDVVNNQLEKEIVPSTFPDNVVSCTTDTVILTKESSKKKKEHVIFSTSVKIGSKEQLFSTQLSITKTPSLTSENSDLFSQMVEPDRKKISEITLVSLPETHIGIVDHEVEPPKVLKIKNSNSSTSHFKESENMKERKSNSVEDSPSSGSELNSEIKKNDLNNFISVNLTADEIEKKGLVVQDSFEDELPYVPTTLPQERSVALPIIPIKERQRSCIVVHPIDRPRSTTPIHPSSLDEYFSDEPRTPDNVKSDKLKIQLPEKVKPLPQRLKSPRRTSNPKNWDEFAEKGIPNILTRRSSEKGFKMQVENDIQELPPAAQMPNSRWINFEEVSERKKMPKRIETIPGHSSEEDHYNYVNPEECQCECHESGKSSVEKEEDEEPLLCEMGHEERVAFISDTEAKPDRRSVISDSSPDQGTSQTVKRRKAKKRQPFNCDLDVRSNRSSFMSEDSSVEATTPQADFSHY